MQNKNEKWKQQKFHITIDNGSTKQLLSNIYL